MKKRSRREANLYKEPSSDLSDLEVSSDESDASAAQGSKRQKAAQKSKRAKVAASQTNEESKSAAPAVPSRTYGKCQSLQNLPKSLKLAPNKMHRVILWMRNDLRIHDNPVLHWAATSPACQYREIVPVYCFDPRFNSRSVAEFRIRKCGIWRTRFQIESVAQFRASLRSLGSGLLVANEKPEDFLQRLVAPNLQTTIVYQAETSDEEVKVEAQVKSKLAKHGADIVPIWGSTLHHIDDLPYNPTEYFPHTYGYMRKKQDHVKVRKLLDTPEAGSLPFLNLAEADEHERKASEYLPDLEKCLGFSKEEVKATSKQDQRMYFKFRGGEEAGLQRLQEYVFNKRSVSKYASTRNNLIGRNYSSKLSPWLANGSISCRQVYWEVKRFEAEQTRNESTTVYIDELFWRDFNRFWCLNHGNKVFSSYGIYDRTYYNWQTDLNIVDRWRNGTTGMPLIDALMREMNETGFMPNRGRMVVACYFAMDLKQDWRHGAHYFEEKLIDHDVQSNYGGWNGSSGIGPGRVLVFNSLLQSQKFDADGTYIRTWCPELQNVPTDYIHDPWNMPKSLQKSLKVQIGGTEDPEKADIKFYPEPISCPKYTSAEAAKKIKRKTSPAPVQKSIKTLLMKSTAGKAAAASKSK